MVDLTIGELSNQGGVEFNTDDQIYKLLQKLEIFNGDVLIINKCMLVVPSDTKIIVYEGGKIQVSESTIFVNGDIENGGDIILDNFGIMPVSAALTVKDKGSVYIMADSQISTNSNGTILVEDGEIVIDSDSGSISLINNLL